MKLIKPTTRKDTNKTVLEFNKHPKVFQSLAKANPISISYIFNYHAKKVDIYLISVK